MCLPSAASNLRDAVNIFKELRNYARHIQYGGLDEMLLNLQLAFKMNQRTSPGALMATFWGYTGHSSSMEDDQEKAQI